MLFFKEDEIVPMSCSKFRRDTSEDDIGNLHFFEPSQINQIIARKYNGDPIELIMQLLKDLQDKQDELLQLKEKYQQDSEDNDLESIKNWNIQDDYHDDNNNHSSESISFDISPELPLELKSLKRKKSKLFIVPVPKSEDLEIDKYGFIKRARQSSTILSSSTDKSQKQQQEQQQQVQRHNTTSNSSTESLGIFINEKDESKLINQLKQISQIHDDTNLYFDKKWDILIKDIRYYFMFSTIHDDANIPSLGIRGVNLNHYYFPFINLINQFGIPLRYRYLWMELSGANDLRINGEYQELITLDKTNQQIMKYFEQIELDLHRTLPSNFYFNNVFEFKPGIYFYKLQRILYAFVNKFPNIGYIQGMNKIIGTLLLGISQQQQQHSQDGDDEESIFWLFISLIEEILPKYNNQCFFNSILEIHEENIKLKKLLKLIIPGLYSHFNKLEVEIEIITMNWWLTLFIDLKLINLDDWFKIFDNLLIGDQNLFLPCLTLAIFKCLEGNLIKLNTNDEIYQFFNMNDIKSQYNLKFHELMKHYLNYSRRKEISDIFIFRT